MEKGSFFKKSVSGMVLICHMCCAKDRRDNFKWPTCFWLIRRRSCLVLTTWPGQHVRLCASFSLREDALPKDGVDRSQSWSPSSWRNLQNMSRLGSPMSDKGRQFEFRLINYSQLNLPGICRNRCRSWWAESFAHHQAEPTSQHPCATPRWSARSWQVGTHFSKSIQLES